ncbi:MAG TPA: FecR domain-containing protein [Gemmatimonadaceae bacterium]|nr:FecR domain-containing protein [Gemmatimonadaceae bacterium]
MASDPRHAELLDELRAHAAPDRRQPGESWNVDAAWSRLSGRIAGERSTSHLALERGHVPARRRRASWRVLSAAGASIAAAAILVLVWRAPRAPSSRTGHTVVREVASARAQQTHVTLRDGTRVVLNAGSRLRYADDFGRASRDVELEGEGYFDVVHDASRPFRVRARGTIAEDIGTRFVVRAYADGSPTQVVVAQGSVALARDAAGGGSARALLLGAGQLGRVEPDGRISVVSDVDVDRWMSWTEGALVLDGLTLADAAMEIGRRYDVRVVVPDAALARRRVSARFHDATLTSVLDALTLAVGARWSNDGIAIVIRRAE